MNRKLLLFYCIFLCPFLQVSAQNFGTFASAVWLTNCNTSNFFNTTGEGANLIGPPANVFTNTNFGVFIQNSGTFILRGGEVKTFKNSNGNACSVRMRYRVYLASASPGTFNTIDFPFFNDCNTAINEFPSGGPCGAGDQKWQRVIANGTTNPYSPVDLTANSPGDYVLEVFYEVTGDFNSASECDDNLILNASGNNYKAFFTVRSNPTFTFTNPTTCNGSDGSITISNLNPNSVYTFSYRDDGVQISPTLINTNSSGSYTLNLLNSGSYSTFNFVINNCSTTINSPVVLTDPIVNPPSSNGDQEVCETNPFQTLTASATTSDGSAIVWYDSPINGNIVSNPTLNSVGTVTYYAEAQNSILNCISATRTPVTLTINPAPAAPSGEATQSICSVATVVFTLSDLVVNGTNLQWYADENLTTPLSSNHPLTHNTTYYVTQTVSGCESITYLAVLVNLNSPITPVFDFGTEITLCSNTEFPILPTTDTNGIVGEWNPSEISSVQGNTYVFTPVNNSCATSFTLSVTLNQFQTPVFNFGNSISICSGDTPPILPDEDNNGINGVWSPATIDTTSNGTYTFIVNNSECAENIELTVIVNELNVPTFDFGSSISLCSGENVPTLPAISNNNVNGVWNPAVINNTQSGSYTFQPSDACAESFTVNVTITPQVTPTFSFGNQIGICFGENAPILPSISNNNVNGVWNPAVINNTQSGSYTFQPSDACAESFTVNVTITPQVTPTFSFGNQIGICFGENAPILPSISNNNVNGVWNPAVINNNQSGSYTFQPSDTCAESFTVNVTITPQVTPTFSFGNQIGICSGENAPILPAISNNNVSGVWNPAVINNTQSGSYIFQPSNACAESFTVNVTVTNPITPVFTLPTSVCFNSTSFILPTVSENGISGTWNPSSVNTTQNTVYQFTPQNTACANSVSVSIAVFPEISFQITDQCENNQFILGVELTNSSNVIVSDFNWMTENGATVGSNSSTFNVTEYIRSTPQTETFPIIFRVNVTTIDGCSLEESIQLASIFCGIQKGISPNDDGSNDFFDLEHFEVQKLSIFNRYGIKVYSKTNYTNQWRGQSDQGEILPSATYYYVIEFKNGETKTGWFYLMQ